METYTFEHRFELFQGWQRRTASLVSVYDFLMASFGRVVYRWETAHPAPQTLCDAVVETTVEAALTDPWLELDQFAIVIGYQHLSRNAPAFHNYTPEQVRTLMPRISKLWRESDDRGLQTAMQHQRDDNLLAYFMSVDEGIPMEYAKMVVS